MFYLNDRATADGLCAIDISLLPSAPDAHASGVQLYTAAYVVISACVGDSPSQGGIAVDIGKLGHRSCVSKQKVSY